MKRLRIKRNATAETASTGADRLSIRQLESIAAVATHLSFRVAAEHLRIAQPALSVHIASAEKRLGVQLFERDRRSVITTDIGADIATRARLALAAIDEMAEFARTGSTPLTGTLHLGVIPTVAPFWLPPLLQSVRHQFPRLRLVLREDQTQRLLTQLNTGELDIALLALPIPGDFTAATVITEEFVLASPNGVIPIEPSKVRASDLDGESLLLLEDGHCLADQALAVCARAGANPQISVRATSLPTLVQMVAGGLGSTLLPESAIASLAPPKNGAVDIHRFVGPPPRRTIGLIWRSSSGRLKEVRLLAETMSERAENVMSAIRAR
jgi:LysR family transcriptional regulator, hydrogen peroxide-inducible genes activator